MVTSRISRAAVMAVIASCAVVRVARAQSAEAELLFDEGDKLMIAGKLAEACDAFEASNRIEARAGTLIRLGQCREQNHQLASAWSAYRDALARAKDPNKRRIAADRIAVIEPRLSYLTIVVSDAIRVDGLAIARNGRPLDRALWNRPLPIDGGDYEITSTAAGHDAWTTRAAVPAEAGKVVVEVVKLRPQHEPVDVVAPEPQVHAGGAGRPAVKPVAGQAARDVAPVVPAPRARSGGPAEPELRARAAAATRLDEPAPARSAPSGEPHRRAPPAQASGPEEPRGAARDALAEPGRGMGGRRTLALGVAGIGGGALAAGVVLGLQAKAREHDAHTLCPEPARCGDAVAANALVAQGRSRALFANVSYGVAAACAVSAAVLWFTGGEPARARVSVAPRLGRSPGVDVLVRF